MTGSIGQNPNAADLAALRSLSATPAPASGLERLAPPSGGMTDAHYANVGQVETPSPGVFSFALAPNRAFVIDSHGPQIETLGADGMRTRRAASAGEIGQMRNTLVDQMASHPTLEGAAMLAALPPGMPSTSPFPVAPGLFQ